MKTQKPNSRRKFMGTLATGAIATGLSMIPQEIKANVNSKAMGLNLNNLATGAEEIEGAIKNLGKMEHPVAYDVSQTIPWGFIWSNVYFLTNGETGTPADKLGVLNVLRHHGVFYALNDATIKKYNLGEFFHYTDPTTNELALRNPYIDPKDGDGAYPLPGLGGIKGLQEMGAVFCVCNMALKVNAQFVAEKMGLKTEDVYADFVAGTLPGILSAPSGVWVLGRLAENKIAYIDASVG